MCDGDDDVSKVSKSKSIGSGNFDVQNRLIEKLLKKNKLSRTY